MSAPQLDPYPTECALETRLNHCFEPPRCFAHEQGGATPRRRLPMTAPARQPRLGPGLDADTASGEAACDADSHTPEPADPSGSASAPRRTPVHSRTARQDFAPASFEQLPRALWEREARSSRLDEAARAPEAR